MERVSIVWLVPIAALAIALGVAWQSYANKGPLIEVLFEDAAGIHARETELKYRDVTVGVVESVSFTEGLDQVKVSIRLDLEVAPYVDEDAQFWVVTPEVSAQGISGLETVLSGVYIEGQWDTRAGTQGYEFEGLSQRPLFDGDGVELTFRSSGGTLSGNTPILYKGVEVGRVGPANVSLDGTTVEADAVVYAPYDSLVTEATRFWDTSGFSLSIGTGGASVDFESLSSLIAGGVSFDTFVSGAPLARSGTEFEIFDNRDTARDSIFNQAEGPPLLLTTVFEGNVSGLTPGAAIELDGLRIGDVQSLNGVVEMDETGAEEVRLLVVLAIRPERLGFETNGGRAAALTYLEAEVSAGLRARLTTGNILTGGLKVQLVSRPEAAPASINLRASPYPRIPSTESEISDVTATAQDALDRINALPIEEILASARAFLDNAAMFVGSEEMQDIPGEVSGILANVREITASDDMQAIPTRISELIAELEGTTAEINAILAGVEEAGLVESVTAAVDQVTITVSGLDETIAKVPEVLDSIQAVADRAAELPLSELVAEVTGLTTSASALFSDPAIAGLPAQLGGMVTSVEETLREAQALVATVNEAGGAERLVAAIDAAASAAQTLDTALAGVPQIVERVDGIVAGAEGIELQALVDRVSALVDSVDSVLASEDTRALPGELNAALSELTAILADLRTGGAVDNANLALASVRDAASGVTEALDGLPALISRANTLLAQTSGTIAGFDENSNTVRDLRAALREVSDAAEGISRLARTLERNPNSLILGR
jgi:paraquat-inducible protein B